MDNISFSTAEINSVIYDLELPQNAFGSDDSAERMKIINCWDSCDVVACPGSGKTTVLLAKLLLLMRRMPFKDGSGICVLTHTNVAINEIKGHLGSSSDILFKHPNFFGTIQSFVDKFFLTPFCAKELNIRPTVNNDHYGQLLRIEYDRKYFPKGWFERNGGPEIGGGFGLFSNIRYNFDNMNILSKGLYGDPFVGISSDTYKRMAKVKLTLMQKGVFCYDDAYSVANYCLGIYPELAKFISKRFSFLFVDEMQDTQKHQLSIIDKAFATNKVRQFYGDLDQAIFNNLKGGEITWDPQNQLNITDSKRFGKAIAEKAHCFSRNIPQLNGNENKESITPHLLLYDDPQKVLPCFSSLIAENGLESEHWNKQNPPFNAVGFVAKNNTNGGDGSEQKTTILSYYGNYNRNAGGRKQYFDTLVSYFQKMPPEVLKETGARVYYNLFLNGLLHLLTKANVKIPKNNKYFTITTYLEYLKNNYENEYMILNKKIAEWIKELESDEKEPAQIKNESIDLFKVGFQKLHQDFDVSCYVDGFITSDDITQIDLIEKEDNFYIDPVTNVKVKIGTIHSVKGETHLATLLFETSYQGKKESTLFFQQNSGKLFCGEKYKRPKNYLIIENRLKVSYVALSRPTKLLCVALHKNRVNCTEECAIEKGCNWKIINVT